MDVERRQLVDLFDRALQIGLRLGDRGDGGLLRIARLTVPHESHAQSFVAERLADCESISWLISSPRRLMARFMAATNAGKSLSGTDSVSVERLNASSLPPLPSRRQRASSVIRPPGAPSRCTTATATW